MNVLIIGYGSIGQRHAGLFEDLGCKVGVVSGRGPTENIYPTGRFKLRLRRRLGNW